MKIHLVGGFLGSGKTTAIIAACKQLMAGGARTAIITNDQGKYLVDSAFIHTTGIPSVEVTGGCFCCNYDQLDDRIEQLRTSYQPDILFAESVGSCADMVATVLKPLLQLKDGANSPSSFSVFCDARLLQARMQGLVLPFSDEVLYIFDKQIEEASLLVINKIDLLPQASINKTISMSKSHFPGKTTLSQNSLDTTSIATWVEAIENGSTLLTLKPLEIDYACYATGESKLAWLDDEILLETPGGQIQPIMISVIESILKEMRRTKAVIAHLKFYLHSEGGDTKVSFTSLEDTGWQNLLSDHKGKKADLMLNARVEMDAEKLQRLVRVALEEAMDITGGIFSVSNASSFHPGYPTPTHRFSS